MTNKSMCVPQDIAEPSTIIYRIPLFWGLEACIAQVKKCLLLGTVWQVFPDEIFLSQWKSMGFSGILHSYVAGEELILRTSALIEQAAVPENSLGE